ncbi:MAG: HNH endonuclease [Actinobacteria bacterium]|nr:HNH endonuclease [Actinomycetota bacterium]
MPDSISPPASKVCTKCGRDLPLASYNKHKIGRYGLRAQCRECQRAAGRLYSATHAEQLKQKREQNRESARLRSHQYYALNKDKVAAAQRQYHADHKEKRNAYGRAYRAANLEACREKERQYAAAHREEARERASKWVREHPDQARESRRKYRLLHLAEMTARIAAWMAEHPEAVLAIQRNRKARKRNATGSHTAADIQAQYDRQKGRCFYCDKKVGKKYHVDHVIPLAKGGGNGPENLVIACPPCNLSKKDIHPMDFCGRLP